MSRFCVGWFYRTGLGSMSSDWGLFGHATLYFSNRYIRSLYTEMSMAIVHEYVPSSSKSGLYLRDGYDGNIVTYQVSATAEHILYTLKYEDEDQLQQEIFNVLHRLGLIYTHNSGVTPPDSLLDLNLDSSEVQSITDSDRETMLSYLLEQSELSEEEHEEIRIYAQNKGIDIESLLTEEAEEEEGQSTTTDSTSGSDSNDSRRTSTNKQEGAKNIERVPHVECEYCEIVIEATEYITHVCEKSGVHGRIGTYPDNFAPDSASVTQDEGVDIIYPDDFDAEYRYYPVCRWCGTRFLRLGSYETHLRSTGREGFDAELHKRNPDQYQRPILLPFDGDNCLVHPDRISESLSSEAQAAIESGYRRTSVPSNHQDEDPDRDTKSSSDTSPENRSSTDDKEETEKTDFEERILAYEQNWLFTDLSRFVDILSRDYPEESAIHSALGSLHNDLLSILEEKVNKTKPLQGSLREYKRSWEAPEVGVRVPDTILEEHNAGDYRGELYIPPGYPIPIKSVHRRLREALVKEDTSDIDTKKFSSRLETSSTDEQSSDSVTEKGTRESEPALDNNDEEPVRQLEEQVPASVIVEVLKEYRKYEKNKREASWFHANKILRQKLETETDIDIKKFREDSID